MADEAVAFNSKYPCCGRPARFHGADRDLTAVVHRKCDQCKRNWKITRKQVSIAPTGVRVDELRWKEVT